MSFGAPSERPADDRTALAVALAHAAAADPHAVPEALWDELRRHFSEVELVELCFVIGYYRGTQLMNVLLDTDLSPDEGGPGG